MGQKSATDFLQNIKYLALDLILGLLNIKVRVLAAQLPYLVTIGELVISIVVDFNDTLKDCTILITFNS